jgi:hypothetical protein
MSTDFQSADDDMESGIALNLRFKAIEELAFHFKDLSATQASHMYVVALRTALIIMLLPLHVHQVQLIHQAVAFQQIERAIHSDAVDPRIDLPRLLEDLRGIQVLFGGFDHAEDCPALMGETQTT